MTLADIRSDLAATLCSYKTYDANRRERPSNSYTEKQIEAKNTEDPCNLCHQEIFGQMVQAIMKTGAVPKTDASFQDAEGFKGLSVSNARLLCATTKTVTALHNFIRK